MLLQGVAGYGTRLPRKGATGSTGHIGYNLGHIVVKGIAVANKQNLLCLARGNQRTKHEKDYRYPFIHPESFCLL
jgi:hypothetical protein